jgi:protein-tyrosine phosphatase
MNQILPYPLWIGHGGEDHDFPAIFDAGIEAVVELAAEEPPFPPSRELTTCRFPLHDGPGNRPELLALSVWTVASLIESGTPTLVCCSGGVSRGPAVVAAALALVERESNEACLKRVARHHPSDVSPGLWREISRLPRDLFEVGCTAR